MHIAVLSFDNPESACARYRIHTPLTDPSITVSWAVNSDGDNHAIDGEALQRADVVIVQRFFPLEFTEPVLEACFNSGKPVIYETDDLLTEIPAGHTEYQLSRRTIDCLAKHGSRFTHMTTTSPSIARELHKLNPQVSVVANKLDSELWGSPAAPASDGPTRILYAGTDTHRNDFASITSILSTILDRHGDNVQLLLFGCSAPSFKGRTGVEFIPPVLSYRKYVEKMRTLSFDIAVAPLADTRFNRGKSHVKWLEYSACGAAGVFSDLPPYHCVEHGVTGLKAKTMDDWADSLEALITKPELRVALAQKSWEIIRRDHLGAASGSELVTLCYELAGR